jgi:hypothetical protein
MDAARVALPPAQAHPCQCLVCGRALLSDPATRPSLMLGFSCAACDACVQALVTCPSLEIVVNVATATAKLRIAK